MTSRIRKKQLHHPSIFRCVPMRHSTHRLCRKCTQTHDRKHAKKQVQRFFFAVRSCIQPAEQSGSAQNTAGIDPEIICENLSPRHLHPFAHMYSPFLSVSFFRHLRNAKHRINTVFFVVKIKYLLKVYGKIELRKTINQST